MAYKEKDNIYKYWLRIDQGSITDECDNHNTGLLYSAFSIIKCSKHFTQYYPSKDS